MTEQEKTRLEIYKQTLIILENYDVPYFGICHSIQGALEYLRIPMFIDKDLGDTTEYYPFGRAKEGEMYQPVLINYPELYSRRPDKNITSGWWFATTFDGLDKRIALVKEAIKELESKQ